VLSVDPARVDTVLERAAAAGVPARTVGRAGGTELVAEGSFRVALGAATRAWRDAIPTIMGASRAEL
jgi:hypothetical protein